MEGARESAGGRAGGQEGRHDVRKQTSEMKEECEGGRERARVPEHF
jgi:hypothetical protein